MAIKTSTSLIAILAIAAFPAFAQDATAPAADAPAETAQDLQNQVQDAAGEAETAVDGATESLNEAAEEAADGEAASEAEATPTAEDDATADDSEAAADAAAPADADAEETPADDAPAADATDEPAAAEETDTASEAEAPAEDATSSEQAADDATDEPKVGSYYVKATHSDWMIRCLRTENNTDPCELYQLLNDSDGNSVAEMTLIPLKNGEVAAGATMVVPLETDLTKGLSLATDSGKANAYPFSFCAPVGCVSRMGFTSGELSALRAGSKAKISLLPFGADPSKPVELELSLAGFTAGFEALSALADETENALEDQPAEEEAPAE